jgi:membrane protein DedA with SNARE-associated domain
MNDGMRLELFLHHVGLPGIGLVVFLENLGIPLPTEAAYLVAQTLLYRGEASLFAVLFALQAGHFFGSWLSYEVGVRFRESRAVREVEPQISEIQKKLGMWLEKYGLLAVFFSRLVGYVRPWSSYIAGLIELPRRPFLAYSFFGSLVFNLASLAFTREVLHFWDLYPAARLAMSASFVIGLLILVAWKISQPKKA